MKKHTKSIFHYSFLLYVNDMPQAVDCELFLYTDDSCLLYQHRDAKAIDTKLNKNLSSVCDWFVDNKLSIHFREGKTKFKLFGTKKRLKQDKISIFDMVQYILSNTTQLNI